MCGPSVSSLVLCFVAFVRICVHSGMVSGQPAVAYLL